MFRHIAIPTDGSRLAEKGVKAGVKLARSVGARITAIYVVPPYRLPFHTEAAYWLPGMSRADFRKRCEKAAAKALAAVKIEAHIAGVPCQTRIVTSPRPHEGILRAARAAKCDAIAMGSHGRGAVAGLLLGSETARVLARSKLPVLVSR
jgi:nucleotide-binding universal stress UspA family protein